MKYIYSFLDYPSNDSYSACFFYTGCSHNCPSCQNRELQEYNSHKYTFEEMLFIAGKGKCDSIVLTGGDPLYYDNIDHVRDFLLYSKIPVCIYTGYPIEYIKKNNIYGAMFYKCGPYIETELDKQYGKTDSTFILSSKNQRLYNKDFELISEANIYHF